MKRTEAQEKIIALVYSILANALIIGGIYTMVQPDPKGIGFLFLIIVYGVIAAVAGFVFELIKWRVNWTLKCLVMIANYPNIYCVHGIFFKEGPQYNLITIALSLFFIYGTYISIKLHILYLFTWKDNEAISWK